MPATTDRPAGGTIAGADHAQCERLLELRNRLGEERRRAMSPAVARALEMADYYLFLGLTYFGYSDRLFPEETPR